VSSKWKAGVVVAFLAALVVGGLAYKRKGAGAPPKLRLFAWSNYFSDELLATFTQRTGIPVEVSYLSSNEELFAKLKAGADGYDLIQPSDYMVRQLVREGMVQPLDHRKLPRLSGILPEYKNPSYDPGLAHSVPIAWGTVGIAVDTAKVKVPVDGVGWSMLFQSPDPKRTSLLDDMREVFSIALILKGIPVNTRNETELAQAKADVASAKDRVLLFTSEPKALLVKEELAIAHCYSLDAAQAKRERASIEYFIPKEGANAWTDNLAIPKGATQVEAAHQFLDFLLEGESMAKLAAEKKIAVTHEDALKLLKEEDRNDTTVYPPADVRKRLNYLEDLGDTTRVVSRLWTELKS
jgi:spermidine/putrescine transport system substrate-binding protein